MNVRKEGKTMEKVSMNKLEMARRAAKGGSGGTIPPATSETLGGVKIGEGVNVSEDGTISVPTYAPPAHSTEEVNTGEKWIDGKDIYMKTYSLDSKVWIETSSEVVIGDAPANIDQLLFSSGAIMRDGTTNATKPIMVSIGSNKVKGQALTLRTELKILTIWYTKAGV